MAYFAASTDDAEKNKEFAESLELDYPILSDPGKEVARAYGVLTEDGKYANRWTFYIGADGQLLHTDKSVSPKTHGADVAAKLTELGVAKK